MYAAELSYVVAAPSWRFLSLLLTGASMSCTAWSYGDRLFLSIYACSNTEAWPSWLPLAPRSENVVSAGRQGELHMVGNFSKARASETVATFNEGQFGKLGRKKTYD